MVAKVVRCSLVGIESTRKVLSLDGEYEPWQVYSRLQDLLLQDIKTTGNVTFTAP
ncbi:hypothetical protein HanRHA438_Chr11g0509871 [Helianthus annuus]|nr:hypothetical protein HanIR_Chr11g0535391 [Helianthus annuus]KAJ0871238.1 hypothetical protein HanRHA438_Chr11g0509871 [Helianthus annuus]